MYITSGRVLIWPPPLRSLDRGGTPNILIFGLFLDNLSISEQIIDRALTIYTQL